MLKAFKTEINPISEQIKKMLQSIGICRFLYNRYVEVNLNRLKSGLKILSANEFDKYVNNELSKEYPWIKECGSKARKKTLVNAETAFKRYLKKQSGKPQFKKRGEQDVKLYFPKNNAGDLKVERHRIKIPTLGWVRLKEKGYIPIQGEVSSCTIEQKADRFYVSILFKNTATNKKTKKRKEKPATEGIGVDLGIKDFAVVSKGKVFKNINKTSVIKKVEKRLKRAQRALSRKLESRKKRGEKPATKHGSNINKNVLRVQKLFGRLARMRAAYRSWVVNMIARSKPIYITLEKLNVRGMKKNKHLAKAISNQGFYDFKMKLLNTCKKIGIELREVGTFYPSSKLCSRCGVKKVQLSLSDRIFNCQHCGFEMDRDLNASINLAHAKDFVVLT